MAIQVGTVDGLINISEQPIKCFVEAIDSFNKYGISFSKSNGISLGTAFQRYVEPVYTKQATSFTTGSILIPALTTSGNEQSPARITYCRKMGLLEIDETNSIFQLTPLGNAILENKLTVEEFSFILLTKMGIFQDGIFKDNLFCIIAEYFCTKATISNTELEDYIIAKYNDRNISKTRFDIIVGALFYAGLVAKVNTNVYVLASALDAKIFNDCLKNKKSLDNAYIDTDTNYTSFVGNLTSGILGALNNTNIGYYVHRFKNLTNFISGRTTLYSSTSSSSIPLQQIFYGAPGTGKSFIIDENTNESNRIRTTFHPDYDYATFVGAYKPTVKMANKYGLFGKDTVALKNEDDSPIKEDVIVYKFIPQAFIKAYVEAWRRYADTECTDKDFYLVIEEINRGNCAQIFGDLFQLLDRTNAGFSSYAVETESDLQDFLTTDEKYKLDIVLTEDIKNDNGKIIATAENVMNGKVLVLPPNLHIWATMNTSDQSLFPIDSAFKRRWDWKYVPIKYANKDWMVMLGDNEICKWTDLQQTLNNLIYDATESEDKMLGDWFVNANEDKIDKNQLVGKIIFYLWNDVAKVDAGKLFDLEIEKNGRKRKVIFSDFYEIDGSVSTVIVKSWLNNIGIELIEINSDTEDNSRKRYKLNNGALESLTDIANHVVRDFANNNPTMNAQQIRDIFVDAYKGCGISHIVETDEEYKLREGQPSLKRSASTVILPNGEIVHVSTQLRAKNEGDNFFNFIKVTKEKGWGEITE